MTGTQIIATALAVEFCAVYVGCLANHQEEIARSWADGLAWVRARAADARSARDVVRRYVGAAARGACRAVRAGLLVVLCAVLRAHGRHRMGVRA